jgi:hypothetical protein
MVETVKKSKISSQLTENYFNEEISNPDWAASYGEHLIIF